MKKVIWIDDSEIAMKEVVQNIFPELWDKDIKSEIYIFGDDVDGNYDETAAINDLNYSVYDTFISYLIEYNLINDPDKSAEKLKLIKKDESDSQNLKSEIVLNKKEILSQHQNEISAWRKEKILSDKEKKEMISCESKDFDLKKIVSEIFGKTDIDDINKDKELLCIMIDLCIIKGDYEKLIKDDENIYPLISSGLFYELSKTDKLVFLYSTFVSPNDAIKKWKIIFNSIYGSTEKKQISIFDRYGCTVSQNEKTLVDLLGKDIKC